MAFKPPKVGDPVIYCVDSPTLGISREPVRISRITKSEIFVASKCARFTRDGKVIGGRGNKWLEPC